MVSQSLRKPTVNGLRRREEGQPDSGPNNNIKSIWLAQQVGSRPQSVTVVAGKFRDLHQLGNLLTQAANRDVCPVTDSIVTPSSSLGVEGMPRLLR
jgi:hypothetical protein